MSQNAAELIARIEDEAEANRLQLPSLPEIILMIREAIDDPNKGVNHVARIIQLDPALSARLLTIANSPLYRGNLQLLDLKQAIQRLGLGVTRNVVTGLIMHNIFNVTSTHLHNKIRALWQHSCRVAAISRVIASLTPKVQPERAMLAGLLHDIGVLPILIYADQCPPGLVSDDVLKDVILQLRKSLGQKIIEDWKLGDDLCQIPVTVDDWSRDHAGPADYDDVVQIAHIHSQFGETTARETPPLTSIPAFNKLSIAKMGPHAGLELIEQAREEINATIRLLNG
jgi:HD-like signal output (HDOD) protein